jgi:hypothetical protein
MAGVKRRTSAIPRPRLQVGVIFGVYFAAIACGVVAVIHGPSNAKYVALAALLVGALGFVLAYVFRRSNGPIARGLLYIGPVAGAVAGTAFGKASPVVPAAIAGFLTLFIARGVASGELVARIKGDTKPWA